MTTLIVNGTRQEVDDVKAEEHSRVVRVDGREVRVELLREVSQDPLVLLLKSGNRITRVTIWSKNEGDHYDVQLNGKVFTVALQHGTVPALGSGTASPEGPIIVSAPMAGKIASLRTTIGTSTTEGQTLLVLEAMKMENEIAAPKTGVVKEIFVQPGALVRAGDKLCLVE